MRFVCSECGKVCAIEDDSAGQPVACGHCNEVTIVPPSLLSPRAIIGDFIINEEIGQGGMGTVFLAHQISLDRTVALKILNDEYAANGAFIVDFVNEARAAARLNHPNIVQAYAVDEEAGHYFFAMEYVEGQTLKEILDEQGMLPVPQALRIMQQIAEALDFAWTQSQLVHRDIKPDNIMLTNRGIAKLADLGLARGAKELMADVEDEVMGTPQYICPEQLTGQPMDVRGDLYSLGATIFHAITGQFPFDGDSPAEIARKHLQDPVPDASAVNPAVPREVGYILQKTMAKRLEDRYEDAAALGDDLQAVLAGGFPAGYEPPATPAGTPQRVSPLQGIPAPVKARIDEDFEDDDFEDIEDDEPIAAAIVVDDDEDEGEEEEEAEATVGGRRRMSIKRKGKRMSLRTGTGTGVGTGAMPAVPPPAGGGGMSKRAKVFLALGIFALLVVVVVGGALVWGFIWLQDQAPASREEALEMYLAAAGAEERTDWQTVERLAAKQSLSRSELTALLRSAQSFREKHPDSLLCRPADDVHDYAKLYRKPSVFNDTIRRHARQWAGAVNQIIARNEESLIRDLRAEQHQQTLGDSVNQRLHELVRTEAATAVAQRVAGALAERKRELTQILQQARADIAHNREVVEQERTEVRNELFALTADYEFDRARDLVHERERKEPDLRDGIRLRLDSALEQSERDRATPKLNDIVRHQRDLVDRAKLVDAQDDPELKTRLQKLLDSDAPLLEQDDVDAAFQQALTQQGIEPLRQEIGTLRDEEAAVRDARKEWFENHAKCLAGAIEYFDLFANTGEACKGHVLQLPGIKRGSSAVLADVQRRHASVIVTYYPAGGKKATRVERLFIQDLGLPNIVKLAAEKWQQDHYGTTELEAIKALFLGYSLDLLPTARKWLADAGEDARTQFLLKELDQVEAVAAAAEQIRGRRREALVELRRFYFVHAEKPAEATEFYKKFAARKEQFGDLPMYDRALQDMRRILGIQE